MDVVKKQIDALRGSLSIASEEGKGCRVSIILPLTLAIIEGLLVQVGVDQFVVPMAAITENVELLKAQRASHNGRNVIAVRGELIPYIDLRQTFRLNGNAPDLEKIVIVRHEDHHARTRRGPCAGHAPNRHSIRGQVFKNIGVVSGATIMGDGRVSLIIDISAVVRYADRQCREMAAGA